MVRVLRAYFLPAVEEFPTPFVYPYLIKAPFIDPASKRRPFAVLLVAMAEIEGRSCPPGVPGIQLKREGCHLGGDTSLNSQGDVCPDSLTVGQRGREKEKKERKKEREREREGGREGGRKGGRKEGRKKERKKERKIVSLWISS